MNHQKHSVVILNPSTGECGVSFTTHDPEAGNYIACATEADAFRLKANYDRVITALYLACFRIADGPQEYHEANTLDGWMDVYLARADDGVLECTKCGVAKHLNEFETPDLCNVCFDPAMP